MTIDAEAMAGKVGRGLSWSTAGNLVLRMGNLLVSIIMARLIAPEQFGVFAVALTIWTILSSLAEFGLGTDLIRATDLTRRIPTVATLGILIGGSLAVAMMAASGLLAQAFDSPESTGVIRVMGLSLFVVGLSVVPAALLQREFRQAAVFGINGAGMVVSAVSITALALAGFGPYALAWGQLFGQLVTMVAQYLVTRTVPRFGFDRTVARESIAFCLPLALANVLSWVLLGIDNLIVARILGPVELGLYVLAFNVSSWPMNAVGQAVRVVALPAFAHLPTPEQRNRALVRVSGPVWAVGLLMGVLLGTLAAPLVDVLYGARWAGAVAALSGLAAFGALRIVLDLFATFLVSAGSSRAVLVVQVWWLVVLVPSMIVGVHWWGLVGAGWTHLVVGLFAVLPLYLFFLRRAGVDWKGFFAAWRLPTVLVIPVAVVAVGAGQLLHPSIVALLVGGAVGVAVFAAVLGRWIKREVKSLKQDITS